MASPVPSNSPATTASASGSPTPRRPSRNASSKTGGRHAPPARRAPRPGSGSARRRPSSADERLEIAPHVRRGTVELRPLGQRAKLAACGRPARRRRRRPPRSRRRGRAAAQPHGLRPARTRRSADSQNRSPEAAMVAAASASSAKARSGSTRRSSASTHEEVGPQQRARHLGLLDRPRRPTTGASAPTAATAAVLTSSERSHASPAEPRRRRRGHRRAGPSGRT